MTAAGSATGAIPPRPSRWIAVACGAALAIFGAALAYATWQARQGRPTVHDEFAYLFQARTLLAGRVAFPSPPLPEFFESMHLLVVPTYSAKYFPGHALLLAPFVCIGLPWLYSLFALGGAAALLFAILRSLNAGLLASAAAAAVFAASGRALFVWSSYLSHPTAALCALGGFYCAARLSRPASLAGTPPVAASTSPVARQLRWAVGLGACAGLAALTRPYCGVALAAAGVAAIVSSAAPRAARRDLRRILIAFSVPLLAAAALGLGYCKATTGSFTTPPWSLYARQYTPADGPGIGAVQSEPPLRALPPHLAAVGAAFEQGRRSYGWRQVGLKFWRQVAQLEGFASSAFVIALAAVGALLLTQALLAPLVFGLVLFLLQLGFHADPGYYLFEAWPAVALLAGWGLHRTIAALAGLKSRPLRLASAAALGSIGLWIAVACADGVREVQAFGSSTADLYARVDRLLAPARLQRSLVFIKYPPHWSGGDDLTQNLPDLRKATLVLANDRGQDDRRLIEALPDRAPFRLDLAGPRLERLGAAGSPLDRLEDTGRRGTSPR